MRNTIAERFTKAQRHMVSIGDRIAGVSSLTGGFFHDGVVIGFEDDEVLFTYPDGGRGQTTTRFITDINGVPTDVAVGKVPRDRFEQSIRDLRVRIKTVAKNSGLPVAKVLQLLAD